MKRWTILLLPCLAACGSGSIEENSDGGPNDAPTADAATSDGHSAADAPTADAGLVAGAYFVAPEGNDDGPGTIDEPWATVGKAAATLAAGETVYIRQGTYAERLVPANAGSEGAPISFLAFPGEQATLDGSDVDLPAGWGGLVEISSTSHIRVVGLRVINAGVDQDHAGILVDRSESITVEDCYTYNTVSSGIGVWRSSDVVVRGNEVELACNDGSQECITVAITDGFEVSHNHVHDTGPGSNGGEGIDIKDGSSNGIVHENLVERTNRLGIYVDAWDAHTFEVEVSGNIVRNTAATGYAVAAEAGGLLENVRLQNNIAYGNYYSGLTIAGWGEAGNAHPISQVYVVNNTIWGNGESGWGPGIVLENPEADDVVIRNNLLSQNGGGQLEAESVGDNLVVDHNLFDGSGAPYGTDYVEGSPLLADTADGNFHLQEGSAAIDQGSATGAPPVDFDGTSRPQGSGYDIGAFEYESD